jgi:hypothetical protein
VPAYVLIVDVFGLALAVIGFTMAFRQKVARQLLGRPAPPSCASISAEEDPLTYILRIAGVMAMVFGVVIAGMITLVNVKC